MFSSQVDADLLVNPTLIKQALQSIATDALGVDEMQVSRTLQYNLLALVGLRLSSWTRTFKFEYYKLRIPICVDGSKRKNQSKDFLVKRKLELKFE